MAGMDDRGGRDVAPAIRQRRDAVFGNLGNIADLMKSAGQLREGVARATEALGRLRVEGAAGDGAVVVSANGKMELISVRLAPTLLAAGDADALEALVLEAANAALGRARDEAARAASQLAGGLPIPGLSNLLDKGGSGPVDVGGA